MVKTFQVTLINEANNLNQTVEVSDNEYILDVAEDKGVDLPFSCRAGACPKGYRSAYAACVGRVIEGELDQTEQSFLDDSQVDKGYALLCVAYAKSNCTIAIAVEEELF